MSMQYTKVPATAYDEIQMNAAMVCTSFAPSTGKASGQLGVTSGGVSITFVPNIIDLGEDMDNVPKNTMELARIDGEEIDISFTMVTINTQTAKLAMAAADIDSQDATKIVARDELKTTDFTGDLWIIGDYSAKNKGEGTAGFCAIHVKNVLSTGGFSWQTQDKGKGQFANALKAFRSLEDPDTVPFEMYIMTGTDPNP